MRERDGGSVRKSRWRFSGSPERRIERDK